MFVSDKSQARAAAQVLSNIHTHACMVSHKVLFHLFQNWFLKYLEASASYNSFNLC